MFINLLVSETALMIRDIIAVISIVAMAISALASIVLILLQQGNSTGIDALGGSSETFYSKTKGQSIEEKRKKWTWICLIVLVIFSVLFYVLQIEALWV